jgi:hypothetical protein
MMTVVPALAVPGSESIGLASLRFHFDKQTSIPNFTYEQLTFC